MNIPYGRQDITEEDICAAITALKDDFLTQGPRVSAFEKAFAEYVGSEYAVAVSNGTAALHLSVMALGIKPGDKVITTPNTFVASANCVKYCGGEVHFVDIDPDTYLISLESCKALLSSHPQGTFKGIIPVNFAGLPVDMKAFRELADEYNLWILEDACHSPGGSFQTDDKEYKCGGGDFADVAIFSFHPVKHIASGEGGMITTNSSGIYNQLTKLRTHGITKNPEELIESHGGWYYEMQELGFNYRITDFQCALGQSQLSRAHEGIKKRRQIAQKYDEAFAGMPIKKQFIPDGFLHAYHLYVIEVDGRFDLYNSLKESGIYAQVHYIPAHLQPYYQQFGYKKGDFPNVEQYYGRCLSLPMYPSLTKEEQDYVVQKIYSFFN